LTSRPSTISPPTTSACPLGASSTSSAVCSSGRSWSRIGASLSSPESATPMRSSSACARSSGVRFSRAEAVERAGGPERLAPGLVAGGQAQAHVLERGEGAVVDHVGHHRRAEALDAARPNSTASPRMVKLWSDSLTSGGRTSTPKWRASRTVRS
jgi:hypothetical protein